MIYEINTRYGGKIKVQPRVELYTMKELITGKDVPGLAICLDEDGNPIVGVYVQLCTDETCLAPVKTDEAGVAVFTPAAEEEYHAKFTKVPAGHAADAEEFDFAAGEKELTIVLKTVADSET